MIFYQSTLNVSVKFIQMYLVRLFLQPPLYNLS